MLVNRRTFNIKQGRMDEAAALLKMEVDSFAGYTGAYRIYISGLIYTAPVDVLVMELEYKDYEEYQRGWKDWGDAQNTAKFMEKWYEVTEAGGTNETWELAASR
jgi:hypothetical protein